jgi:hypothetical protein
MRAPIRVAILECDTLLDNTRVKYGSYGGVYEALLRSSAKALDRPETIDPQSGLDISKWNVMEDRYPELEDIDAILITGSSMSSYTLIFSMVFYILSPPEYHQADPYSLIARIQCLRRCLLDKQVGGFYSQSSCP